MESLSPAGESSSIGPLPSSPLAEDLVREGCYNSLYIDRGLLGMRLCLRAVQAL